MLESFSETERWSLIARCMKKDRSRKKNEPEKKYMTDLTVPAILLLLAGGLSPLFCGKKIVYAAFCIAACAAALTGALYQIFAGNGDGLLAALFQIPIALIGLLAAVHAIGYVHERHGIFWCFFNWMLASMLWVTIADFSLEFLFAWEAMGVTSFALVAFEYHEKKVRQAAWIYLLACHAGAMFLIPAFVLGGCCWGVVPVILGLIGFGLKAGFPMLHVWLPAAHPEAPAPVSAVMSGAMINLGFYGILRMPCDPQIPFLHLLGWVLLIMGLAGAFGGALFAVSRQNLKQLLAYSSVENMGIIAMGAGLGFLGAAEGSFTVAAAGFAGAVLHILNHAVLKGALFLGAGSVMTATHSLNMDRFGGLMKRMPRTGWAFLFSSISLSGLPPFNAFVGELMIYVAAFTAILDGSGILLGAGLPVLPVLALTGALAATAFVKAYGTAFLGEPRSEAAAEAREVSLIMQLPVLICVILSMVLLFSSPWLIRIFAPIQEHITGSAADDSAVTALMQILQKTALFSAAAILLFFILILFRRALPNGKKETVAPTWDCGYARPTARMEYTGTAFVQPVVDFFARILKSRKTVKKPEGLFPEDASITVETEDCAERVFWGPVFRLFGRIADKVHHLQSGYLHLYVLFMVAALLLMLAWSFFGKEIF